MKFSRTFCALILILNLGFSVILVVLLFKSVENKQTYFDDICGLINGQRVYLDFGEKGTLIAKYENNPTRKYPDNKVQQRCAVQFVTCPSCIIEIKFKFLNISRSCGKSAVLDNCGCDYIWVFEPPYEQASGEQFCGRFIENNQSFLYYNSQTRSVVVSFIYNNDYAHAFTLDYTIERNRFALTGYPKVGNTNNLSQTLSSPFFPNMYPNDISLEHIIQCESTEKCRISLVFNDYQVADSSIIEFFDWNGQRIYVTTGSIFRPPVIISTGPSLVIKFYANGASSIGYKATYSFILGDLDEAQIKPDIDCGGYVNNLGGGITMMNMVEEGTKFYDCVWLLKPPSSYSHMKTHLYVKVATFSNFAGSTELTIHQGLTSDGPAIEVLRLPIAHFYNTREKDHVVPINEGFYISFRGLFRPESRLAIVYAGFNYKDCFFGSDFLCHNLRCISVLLNCDGFDHCGDNSDELSTSCSQDPRDRRKWNKTPNFLFPQIDGYSDLTTATLVFLLCSFGLIGLIFAMAILLYRINLRSRHQRQIQDHIETIQAILEESTIDVEEEIIIPDDPPDYEAPPEYNDVMKVTTPKKKLAKKCRQCHNQAASNVEPKCIPGTSRSCQTTPLPKVPDSPPPAYSDLKQTIPPVAGPSILKNDVLTLIQDRVANLKLSVNNIMRRSRRPSDTLVKCYSDSELNNLSSFTEASLSKRNILSKLRVSFSSDDLNSLM